MSLEVEITKLTSAVEALNASIEKILSTEVSAAADEKPKATRTRKSKDDAPVEESKTEAAEEPKTEAAEEPKTEAPKADDTEKRAAVFASVGAWVKEVQSDQPEFDARKAAAIAAFKRLDGAKGETVKDLLMSVDASQIPRIDTWLEKKKTTDHSGVGVNRFTAEPKAESKPADDDI